MIKINRVFSDCTGYYQHLIILMGSPLLREPVLIHHTKLPLYTKYYT